MDIPITDKRSEPGNGNAKPPESLAHIVGWGADLDRANRPGYPMERHPPRPESDTPLARQAANVDVLQSIERTGPTAVFGTTCPPRGISGMLRRIAFRYSESDLRHWLVLLFADRVDMVEGMGSDLARGHVPNLYREMGGPAELKHNPAGAAKKALWVLAVGGLGYWALKRRSSRRP